MLTLGLITCFSSHVSYVTAALFSPFTVRWYQAGANIFFMKNCLLISSRLLVPLVNWVTIMSRVCCNRTWRQLHTWHKHKHKLHVELIGRNTQDILAAIRSKVLSDSDSYMLYRLFHTIPFKIRISMFL